MFWAHKKYNILSPYLRSKYDGMRVGKICIDGGFTCPNRDGACGIGGCIFCGERGAGEHIDGKASIEAQARAFLASPSAEKAGVYAAYFQNFTNTYAPVDVLRERYSAALIDPRIRILAVGTRPDCIDTERADLLGEFARTHDVWCELGLQTSNDSTAQRFNRGYPTSRFTEAVSLLAERGIEVIAHVIIGLPGETEEDVYETVRFVNSHPVKGLKLHSLYVTRDTVLHEMYQSGEYTPLTLDGYIKAVTGAICRTRPDIIFHRVTGDAPHDLLVAPEWNLEKNRTVTLIDKYMSDNGLYQGCMYEK